VRTDDQVKKALRKARLLLHTDKLSGQPEKVRLRAELILVEIDRALKGT
jgi:curved DNA-binding protein CbpA